MNIIVRLLFIFEICATAGWCLEVVYRSLNEKRFVNPGFLNGCYLPIYGIGGTILFFACEYLLSFSTIYENLICIFLISCLGMTFIELVGGLIIIKQFNLRLWDYSDNKWNYKGVICPLFSFFWGLLGMFFFYFLFPVLFKLSNNSFDSLYILGIGFYFGIFAYDLSETIDMANRLRIVADMIKREINFEKLKSYAKLNLISKKESRRMIDYLPTKYIGTYISELRERVNKQLENAKEISKIQSDNFKEDYELAKKVLLELYENERERFTKKGK